MAQADAFDGLAEKLNKLISVADQRTGARAEALKERLNEFSAKITLVGQVKAGKSALTNILSGQPGLLPSDVNPWTSVVTTIMVNSDPELDGLAEGTKAAFTFFDQSEWDNLVVGGGRLGELADRAGASEELVEIQQQIQKMRDATQERLGSHFEFLLGQNHSYGYVDTDLMERYVCFGDEDYKQEYNAKTGRFADITKSADLYIDVPQYKAPLRICDTPGVNDTFMMREQITIRSLRGSELCVVVLSAHQALTTIDMALMRIIATLDKRQIILFVNRIDELADPAEQIPEIHAGILETLKSQKIDESVPVVFGSALWAEAALMGDAGILPSSSQKSLTEFILGQPNLDHSGEFDPTIAWAASGIPELMNAIGQRVSEGSAKRLYERVRRNARNITNEARATVSTRRNSHETQVDAKLLEASPDKAIATVQSDFSQKVESLCSDLQNELIDRMDKAVSGFVKRATDSLIDHLGKYGEQGTWHYDPTGLRVLQRSAYVSFSRNVRSKVNKLMGELAGTIEAIYRSFISDDLTDFAIEAPEAPVVPPPVGLGKTIALDLQSSWWRRWWQKRRGFEAFANDYAHLIREEAQSVTDELVQTQVLSVLEQVRELVNTFVAEHKETIEQIVRHGGRDSEDARNALQSVAAMDEAHHIFGEILKGLEEEAA